MFPGFCWLAKKNMSEGHKWQHAICDDCWRKENPQNPDRIPYRLVDEYRKLEMCCFCGQMTLSGIFVRRDRKGLKCDPAARTS